MNPTPLPLVEIIIAIGGVALICAGRNRESKKYERCWNYQRGRDRLKGYDSVVGYGHFCFVYLAKRNARRRPYIISSSANICILVHSMIFVKLLVTICKLLVCIVIFTIMTYAAGGCDDWGGLDCSKNGFALFVDRVYFTTTTLTTVGYGDIVPATFFTRLSTATLGLLGYAFIISSLTNRPNGVPPG